MCVTEDCTNLPLMTGRSPSQKSIMEEQLDPRLDHPATDFKLSPPKSRTTHPISCQTTHPQSPQTIQANLLLPPPQAGPQAPRQYIVPVNPSLTHPLTLSKTSTPTPLRVVSSFKDLRLILHLLLLVVRRTLFRSLIVLLDLDRAWLLHSMGSRLSNNICLSSSIVP